MCSWQLTWKCDDKEMAASYLSLKPLCSFYQQRDEGSQWSLTQSVVLSSPQLTGAYSSSLSPAPLPATLVVNGNTEDLFFLVLPFSSMTVCFSQSSNEFLHIMSVKYLLVNIFFMLWSGGDWFNLVFFYMKAVAKAINLFFCIPAMLIELAIFLIS